MVSRKQFRAEVHNVSKHGQSIDVSRAKYDRIQHFCLSSFTLLRTFSLVTLLSQLIFLPILFHIYVSKASNLLLSACVNVHVSTAYSATLQTKHFIIVCFSSRFILPRLNNFFFSTSWRIFQFVKFYVLSLISSVL